MRKGFLGLTGQSQPSGDVEGGGPGAMMEMLLQGPQLPWQGKGRKRGDWALRRMEVSSRCCGAAVRNC